MNNTQNYILAKIAPIFNKKGYVSTSLADITKASKLTKGAIYCNFKNKEELALKSFYLNVQIAILPLQHKIKKENNSIDKLFALTNYYKNYYNIAKERGGCPILNVSIDAKYNNFSLFNASKKLTKNLIKKLTLIIQEGINNNEIKKSIEPKIYAQNFYAMIEGAVFMSILNENKDYLTNIMNLMEDIIRTQFKT